MIPQSYPCPISGGGIAEEYALAFDQDRAVRILIVPALLDEASKLRRFTVEVMRRLDGAGFDCLLPDLPGCNESRQDLANLELEGWATAMHAAARHFGATHVLGIRGGGLILPPALPGWLYAPVTGASLLKTLLRARVIGARESGREENVADLLRCGVEGGIELSGYSLSGEMLRQLQDLEPAPPAGVTVFDHDMIGGGALWLRAEPGHDPAQADALAAAVTMGLAA